MGILGTLPDIILTSGKVQNRKYFDKIRVRRIFTSIFKDP